MRRAATSANVLRLPASQSGVSLSIVRGRQQVIRSQDIFISIVSGRRRMVYRQVDGEIVLADTCKCFADWQPDFVVTLSVGCPIDVHRSRALQELQNADD